MFNSTFAESRTLSASLPEDDPDIFSLFLEWVYTKHFTPVTPAMMNEQGNSVLFMNRVKLYIFAEKLCLDELCDYTMSNLISLLKEYNRSPSVPQMREAYKGSAQESPIRRFMCMNFYYHLKSQDENSHWSTKSLSEVLVQVPELCKDFLGLEREWSTKKGEMGAPKEMRVCGFHKHGEGRGCGVRGGRCCEWGRFEVGV